MNRSMQSIFDSIGNRCWFTEERTSLCEQKSNQRYVRVWETDGHLMCLFWFSLANSCAFFSPVANNREKMPMILITYTTHAHYHHQPLDYDRPSKIEWVVHDRTFVDTSIYHRFQSIEIGNKWKISLYYTYLFIWALHLYTIWL